MPLITNSILHSGIVNRLPAAATIIHSRAQSSPLVMEICSCIQCGVCWYLPPYGFNHFAEPSQQAPNIAANLAISRLSLGHVPTPQYFIPGLLPKLPYPSINSLLIARITSEEWRELESEVEIKLMKYRASQYPCCCALFCMPCIVCYAICSGSTTAKEGHVLNIMYELLAKYNATLFHPRLMHARLYVTECIGTVTSTNSDGYSHSSTVRSYTLQIGVHIAGNQEEFLALPRAVVGQDAGYPKAIGNCLCFTCPPGGLCCCYPVLDHQLDGPRVPVAPAPLPVIPAHQQGKYVMVPTQQQGQQQGQYTMVPVSQHQVAPFTVSAQGQGYAYTAPTVQMIDHR